MRFEVKDGVVNCKMIKISRSDANSKVCKEEFLIFADNFPGETLIQLLKENLATQEHFEWFAVDGGNNDTLMVYSLSPQDTMVYTHVLGPRAKGIGLEKSSYDVKDLLLVIVVPRSEKCRAIACGSNCAFFRKTIEIKLK